MKKGTAIFPGWLFPFVYCVAGVDAYGWTLPSQTQFQALIDSGLTRSNFMKAPYYLVRGGSFSYYTDSSSHAGSEGYYRSSTPNRNNTFKYFLTFSSSNMEVDSGWDYGYFSVRCVAAG